jgi:hypothetical protein
LHSFESGVGEQVAQSCEIAFLIGKTSARHHEAARPTLPRIIGPNMERAN